jgi:hypothetical protein
MVTDKFQDLLHGCSTLTSRVDNYTRSRRPLTNPGDIYTVTDNR